MKTIASENVKSPRALVIDPFLGMMWWSDWSTKTIEMSEMDGTNRKTIVNKGIEWANGIAIDYAGKYIGSSLGRFEIWRDSIS